MTSIIKKSLLMSFMLGLCGASWGNSFFSSQSEPPAAQSKSPQTTAVSQNYQQWQKQYRKQAEQALKRRLLDPKDYGLTNKSGIIVPGGIAQ